MYTDEEKVDSIHECWHSSKDLDYYEASDDDLFVIYTTTTRRNSMEYDVQCSTFFLTWHLVYMHLGQVSGCIVVGLLRTFSHQGRSKVIAALHSRHLPAAAATL